MELPNSPRLQVSQAAVEMARVFFVGASVKADFLNREMAAALTEYPELVPVSYEAVPLDQTRLDVEQAYEITIRYRGPAAT